MRKPNRIHMLTAAGISACALTMATTGCQNEPSSPFLISQPQPQQQQPQLQLQPQQPPPQPQSLPLPTWTNGQDATLTASTAGRLPAGARIAVVPVLVPAQLPQGIQSEACLRTVENIFQAALLERGFKVGERTDVKGAFLELNIDKFTDIKDGKVQGISNPKNPPSSLPDKDEPLTRLSANTPCEIVLLVAINVVSKTEKTTTAKLRDSKAVKIEVAQNGEDYGFDVEIIAKAFSAKDANVLWVSRAVYPFHDIYERLYKQKFSENAMHIIEMCAQAVSTQLKTTPTGR